METVKHRVHSLARLIRTVKGMWGLLQTGEYKEAVKLIKDKIPLPSSIGRICRILVKKSAEDKFVDAPIQ